jgi:ABC-type transport system involved in multi-copper enzyme maturation permease subunit
VTAVARRPSFFGAVRGEGIKVSRQLSFWLLIAGGLTLLGFLTLGLSGGQSIQDQLKTDPTGWAYWMRDLYGTYFQAGSSVFLLIIGSRLFAMEYSSGTIRVLYSRGIGRLVLLLAKMVTLVIVGVAFLAAFLVVEGGIVALLVNSWSGGLAPLQQLPDQFWQGMGIWALVQGISMGMAILLAAAAAAIGRSLVFALAASLAYFPLDNFAVILERLGAQITGHDHPWLDVSQYQVGVNLNVLLGLVEPDHHSQFTLPGPLQPVDLTHVFMVIGAFALGFVVIATVRTVRPDVLE